MAKQLSFSWMDFNHWIRHFSWQHRVFLLVQIVAAAVCWYLWTHLPAPGWAVAILAGVAAAMSIHGEMRGWQKAVWMLLIGALLIIELRAISKDRTDAQTQALLARKQQDEAFKQVRKNQDDEFQATAGSLKAAIEGISSTLKTANQTMVQTRP